MTTEITYAEVKFKNEAQSLAAPSQAPAAPEEKTSPPPSNSGNFKLLLAAVVILLLLTISFLIAFVTFFQKYSKLIQEKKLTQEPTHTMLECKKEKLNMKGKHPACCTISLAAKSGPFKNVLVPATFTEYTQARKWGNVCYCLVQVASPAHCMMGTDPDYYYVNTGKSWSCCPKNWEPFGSSCYFFSTETRNWTDSEKNCERMQAHLLVVDSKEEQDFVNEHGNQSHAYYLGLSDWKNGHWEWVNETPYNQNVTFWHPNEPTNGDEHCVVLDFPKKLSKWGWNDIPCDLPQNSICEMLKIYL